ncbi:zinc-dependent alcohol dehydrogenase [Raineyella fluvialis]|uniref:zinc-dependent alcohol dehydrogenase n=1 Tax=Raineyella fluvialis TaxID=2662261 RepID=UPI001E28530F|nr:zinc-binding alcohol dehydrogenase [Raineyella fluvialis]
MASALVLLGPRHLVVEDIEPVALESGQARVRTLYSGISAGTELASYRGVSPFLTKHWDPDVRLFTDGGAATSYPLSGWGYEEVGTVIDVHDRDDADLVGATVYGIWGHRTEAVVAVDHVRRRIMPAGLDPLLGIFSRMGSIALNGVHDARIRIGETVVVFGLGVLGLIVVQLAKASGATVIGVDGVAARRDLARRFGCSTVLDVAEDVAGRVKVGTEGRGADVVIEATGSSRALAEAIRCAAYNSRVVAMGFIQGEARGLYLAEEFHHNRVSLVCSQISGTDPEIDHRWNALRLAQTVMRLQAAGTLDLAP